MKEHFLAGAEVGESVHMKAAGVVYNLKVFIQITNRVACTPRVLLISRGAWHDEILMWEVLLKVIIDWCVKAVGYTWCIENRSLLTVR